MKLRVKNGIIYDEFDSIVGSLNDGVSDDIERTIECGSDAIPIIQKVVDEVNSGSFKPRSIVKEFEKLLEKYEIKVV